MSRFPTAIAGACAALTLCIGALALPAGASANTSELVRLCHVGETDYHQQTATLVNTRNGPTLVVEDNVTCIELGLKTAAPPTVDPNKIDKPFPHFPGPPRGAERYAVVECGERGSTAVEQQTESRAATHTNLHSLGPDHAAMLAACDGELGDSGSGASVKDMIDASIHAPSSAAMDCNRAGSANPYAQAGGAASNPDPNPAGDDHLLVKLIPLSALGDVATNAAFDDANRATLAAAAAQKSAAAAQKTANDAKAAAKAASTAADRASKALKDAAKHNASIKTAKTQAAADLEMKKLKEAAAKAEAERKKAEAAAAAAAAAAAKKNEPANAKKGEPAKPEPKPAKKKPSGGTQPGPTKGDGSLCADLQRFIWECEQSGWKTGECQMFRDMLERCVDMTIARISEDGAMTCGQEQIPPEEMDAALRASCEVNTRPVPGHDPCDPTPPPADGAAPSPNPPSCDPTISYTTDGGACPSPEPVETPDPGPECPPPAPGTPPMPCEPSNGPVPGPGPKKTADLGDLGVVTATLKVPQLSVPTRDDMPVTTGMPQPNAGLPAGGPAGHYP